MIKYRRFLLVFACCILLSSVFAACRGGSGAVDSNAEGTVYLYYLNQKRTGLLQREYEPQGEATQDIFQELIQKLSGEPDYYGVNGPLPDRVSLQDVSLSKHTVWIDYSASYREADVVSQTLCNAAFVLTLTQLPEILAVRFSVNGEELTNASGEADGTYTKDDFVAGSSGLFANYYATKLVLYLANNDGTALRSYTYDAVFENSISVERYVISELISWQSEEQSGYQGCVNPDTQILDVETKNGVCYVDLTREFLDGVQGVSPEITIYAIVNSLTELGNIHYVQLTVEDETDVMFGNISLNQTFSKNWDYVEVQEEATTKN